MSFFRPFWADCWIIDIDAGYEDAVVGHPSQDYLWILSRTPTLDSRVCEDMLVRLRGQGYDTGRLACVVHRDA